VTDYDNAVLALGADGYWKLDEASGLTFADSSGGGHPLVASASAVQAYHFPGPSNLQIPLGIVTINTGQLACATNSVGSRAIGASFSCEIWMVAIPPVPNLYGLMVKGDAATPVLPWYSLSVDATGHPTWWFRDAGSVDYKFVSLSNVNDGSTTQRGPWHHIVGTYTPGTAKLYVDGFLSGTFTVPNTGWGTGAQGLTLNNFGGNRAGPWLAAAAIYPGQLSDSQVAANFELGIQGNAFTFSQQQTVLNDISADLSAILAAVRKTYTSP